LLIFVKEGIACYIWSAIALTAIMANAKIWQPVTDEMAQFIFYVQWQYQQMSFNSCESLGESVMFCDSSLPKGREE